MIVLSYNQEAFVAKAVEAALAQSHSPLEIVISDDCSSDRTFEIIQEIASRYSGPHKVVLNRNLKNMGLVAHLNKVIEMATGTIIIPAYGDDISFPNRVQRIFEAFQKYDPLLVHSYAVPIDREGKEIESFYRKANFFRTTDPVSAATSLVLYLGASGAWNREVFDKYGLLKSQEVFDDLIFGFRAALEGRIHLINQNLLYYREGVGISHLKRKGSTRQANRKHRTRIIRMAFAVFSDRLEDAGVFGLTESDQIVQLLRRQMFICNARLAYYGIGDSFLQLLRQKPRWAIKGYVNEFIRDLKFRP